MRRTLPWRPTARSLIKALTISYYLVSEVSLSRLTNWHPKLTRLPHRRTYSAKCKSLALMRRKQAKSSSALVTCYITTAGLMVWKMTSLRCSMPAHRSFSCPKRPIRTRARIPSLINYRWKSLTRSYRRKWSKWSLTRSCNHDKRKPVLKCLTSRIIGMRSSIKLTPFRSWQRLTLLALSECQDHHRQLKRHYFTKLHQLVSQGRYSLPITVQARRSMWTPWSIWRHRMQR